MKVTGLCQGRPVEAQREERNLQSRKSGNLREKEERENVGSLSVWRPFLSERYTRLAPDPINVILFHLEPTSRGRNYGMASFTTKGDNHMQFFYNDYKVC